MFRIAINPSKKVLLFHILLVFLGELAHQCSLMQSSSISITLFHTFSEVLSLASCIFAKQKIIFNTFVSHSYLLVENVKQFPNCKRNLIGKEFFFRNFNSLLFSIKIKSCLSSQNHTTIFTNSLESLASLVSLS